MDIIATTFDVLTADERTQLEAYLETYRAAIEDALEGITEDEARTRLVPSKTTLLGLVKHLTYVELIWFGEAVTGTPRTELGLPAVAAESFDLDPDDTVAGIRQAHRRACAASRDAAAALDLDDVVPGLTGHRSGPMTVRWIHLHLIRELIQHVGHAEILREQLLARRG